MKSKIIAQLVKAIRAAEDSGTLSRYELAKRSKVPQSTLSRLVNGERESLRVETVEALCRELGYRLDMRPAKKGRKS